MTRLLLVLLSAALICSCAHSVAPPHSPDSAASKSQPKIVLYSTSWCPHCKEAREYFKKNGIAYTDRDVEEDSDAMEALVEKYRSRAVPVIVFGNDEKIMKGFKQEEFEKAYKEFQDKP